MEKIEQLSEKLEASYQQFEKLIGDIKSLEDTLTQIESTSDTVIKKYEKALDSKKLTEIQKSTEKEYKKMVEKLEDLGTKIQSAEWIHQQLSETIDGSLKRLERFEKIAKSSKDASKKTDNRLGKLLRTAEVQYDESQNKFAKASALFDANREIEKYDELIKLEKENNKLLKQIDKKLSKEPKKKNKMKNFQSDTLNSENQ